MSSSEWKTFKLEELIESGTSITYGVVKPGIEDENGVKFIRGGDIANGKILIDTLRTITREVSEQYKRTKLQGGELVISLVGNPGEVAIVPNELRGANLARQVGVVRLKKGVETKFVKYFLMSSVGKEKLFAKSVGSVQQVINLSDLRELEIHLPNIQTQRRIADILSALDEKIELNRQTNATLEAIAQAIFKEWFVDFNFPGATGELVESELGLIPHGWRVGSIADILQLSNETITPGSTPDVEFFHYSIPAYDNGRVPSLDLGASILSNKFRVRNNSILVSKLNPRIPRIWAIQTADEKRSICSTEFQVFLSQKPYLYAFGLNLFGQESIVEIMKSRASGTSGSHQRVKPQDILDIQIVLPSDDVLKVYEQTVGSYSQFIEDCLDESATLATLRDALLPKLMSGEIDV